MSKIRPILIRIMLAGLEKHHRDLIAGIEEVRKLAEVTEPDLARLASARLSLSRLSSARTRYVTEQIIPMLLPSADDALRNELAGMQKTFADKRLRSSQHVTRWNTQSIAADWEGYKLASGAIRAMMKEQIDRERRVLGERLRRAITHADGSEAGS